MEILNVNGCKVVYHYLPSKLTNIQFLTNIGSAAEISSEWGYFHMLEHMFFKGSKKYPGANQIPTEANNIGGKLNAWTGTDTTCYHITVLNESFAKGFDIVADMYQNPLFPEDEFKKEVNPILSELRQNDDNPGAYLGSRIMASMWGDKLAHPTIGTEESILGATIEKLGALRDKYYGGDNTMISIVGGVSLDVVVKTIEELFTYRPKPEVHIFEKAEYKSGELILEKDGITESIYSLTYPAFDRNDVRSTKQGVMSYILGGNDSGILFERIRAELGMSCYGIYASHMQLDSYSIIEISCGISPDEVPKLDSEVRDIIKKLCNEKISSIQLERAKASLRTSIALGIESSAGYNGAISLEILKGETVNPIDKILSEIECVTAEDVLETSQITFGATPFFGVLNPTK